MPVAQPGAPKCPPFASLCECNKNHYYYYTKLTVRLSGLLDYA